MIKYFVVIFTLIVSSFVYLRNNPTEKYDINKTIHIYHDPASIPAMYQAMHLLKLPKDEIKFVTWARHHKFISRKLMKKYNIKKFKYKLLTSNTDWFIKKINKIHQKYPNNKIQLYGNIYHHTAFFRTFLINYDNFLKNVSFYEYAVGFSLYDNDWHKTIKMVPVPVTYHLAFKDIIKQKNSSLNLDYLVNANINDEFTSLTAEQQDDFFELMGLDIKKLEKITQHNDFCVFLDQAELNTDVALPVIYKLLKDKPELKNMVWIYKNHHEYKGKLFNKLKKILPKIYYIDHKIPFEVFSLAKFSPKYVMGYSSSAFFYATNKQVLKYFKREDDKYLPYLKQLGIITDQQVIDIQLLK